jgi:hypothetical protein
MKLPAVLAAVYFCAVWVYLGTDIQAMLLHLVKSMAGILIFWIESAAILRFIHYVRVSRPHYPIRTLFGELKATLCDPDKFAYGFVLYLILSITCAAFWILKVNFGDFAAAGWDLWLTEIDRTLHFGRLPWEWLQPLVGHWPVTFILNVNYQIWLLVMWMMVLYFLFADAARTIRRRYLLAFVTTWIVGGSVLAALLVSAGPCYFGPLGMTPNPYEGLMAYLHTTNREIIWLPAVWTQDLLWRGYTGLGERLGISAMPSLHNAVALLNVLVAWSVNRKLAWLLAVHAALVFVGSVHLGWHYAVDAYIGWALVGLIWTGTAFMARFGRRTLAYADQVDEGRLA